MADPVADKSAFLRMYMSNHPDTLVAYAKWFGKVAEPIASAEMSAIDTKSMTLKCTMKTGAVRDVRVPIEPPLAGYEDVKPRLLEMKALAQEGLGMIATPKITTFRFPHRARASAVLLAAVLYFTFAPRGRASLLFLPAQMLGALVGGRTLDIVFGVFIFLHVLESCYTYSLCRRHGTGIATTAVYLAATLAFGYPIWTDFRKRVQAARIDSVMKVE